MLSSTTRGPHLIISPPPLIPIQITNQATTDRGQHAGVAPRRACPRRTVGPASSPRRSRRWTVHETSGHVQRRWLSVPCDGTRCRAARLRRKLTSTDLTARHQPAATAARPPAREPRCFSSDPNLHASCAMPWGAAARPFSVADERDTLPATGDVGHLLPGQPRCMPLLHMGATSRGQRRTSAMQLHMGHTTPLQVRCSTICS
jgi:hypothetical protein